MQEWRCLLLGNIEKSELIDQKLNQRNHFTISLLV
jgi:hypothetical protein